MKMKNYKIKDYKGLFGLNDDTGCPRTFEAEISEEGTLDELVDDVVRLVIPDHKGWDFPFFTSNSPYKQIIDKKNKMAAINIGQSHGGVGWGTTWANGIYAIKVDKTKVKGNLIAFDFDSSCKYNIVSLKNGILEYSEGQLGYTKRCNIQDLNKGEK